MLVIVAAACGLLLPAAPAQAAPEPCAAGYVRLTFDDGPNRTATPDILDTLAEHEVTQLIKLTTAIAHRLGIDEAANPELAELQRTVAPEVVLERIEETTDEGK